MGMMTWAAVGGAAFAGWFFFLRGKPSRASGADEGATWSLVKDDAPRVPTPGGSGTIPIWYKAPVDPSERWAALAKVNAASPKPDQRVIVVVVVQRKGGASGVVERQALSLEVVSTEAAKDGSLTGRVTQDVLPAPEMAKIIGAALLGDAQGWTPKIGDAIVFTPSDVIAFIQP